MSAAYETRRKKKQPREKGTKAHVQSVIDAAHEGLEAERPITLRQVHYRLVSRLNPEALRMTWEQEQRDIQQLGAVLRGFATGGEA